MLNPDQFLQYSEQGFVFIPELILPKEIDAVTSQIPELCALSRPEVVFEKDKKTVRSLLNVHTFCNAADTLFRNPLIRDTALQIIGTDAYIFQSVLNLKRAFTGDVWQWHQDLPTYLVDEGMPGNRLVNVLIFMEEVNEFNGPLMLVPGSHKDEPTRTKVDDTTTSYPIRALPDDEVAQYINENGITAPKGPAGSVIFANTNIIHGSAPNMSPWSRAMISLTINSLENKHQGSQRPEWVVMNDFTPI